MTVDANGFETRLSRVEQRVSDLDKRIVDLATAVTQVTVLVERVENLRREMIDRDQNTKIAINLVGTQVTNLDREWSEREDRRAREHREGRRAMYALTVTIICALIGATVVLITSFVH